MAERNNDDFDYDSLGLSSPEYQTLNLWNPLDDLDTGSTLPGMNPSSGGRSNSSQQLGEDIGSLFMPTFEDGIDNATFSLNAPTTDPLSTTEDGYLLESLLNENENDKLTIIAEPKNVHRLRCNGEVEGERNRANRFIRTGNPNRQYEYPTVKIPESWRHRHRQLYVQVRLVTTVSDRVPYRCIHPYEIDGRDEGIIKDSYNNLLYFLVHENELITGEKSFKILIHKKTHEELRNYGPMRLFNPDQHHDLNLENPQDVRQRIAIYRLYECQFVFTIAEEHDDSSLPRLILSTSVESQIMVDGPNLPITHSNHTLTNVIKCVPQKGGWDGNDEVLLIMSSSIQDQVYKIYFDFGSNTHQAIHEVTAINTKTFLFRTPPCPLPQSNKDFKAMINIQANNGPIQQMEFTYLTSRLATNNTCPICQSTADYGRSSKRPCEVNFTFSRMDSVSKMNQLSLEQTTSKSPIPSVDKREAKFDKYLNQLKAALETFVRTNDPSRLFRRTRILLSNSDENPPPLNDAIERGHTQLALALIEQVIDMSPPSPLLEKVNDNGETPLLIAAKINQWKLIEIILQKRSNLAQQKDNDGNNILHLLARLSADAGAETIENVFKILPKEIKLNLLKEKNQNSQTPLEIAHSLGNTFCFELLNNTENNNK